MAYNCCHALSMNVTVFVIEVEIACVAWSITRTLQFACVCENDLDGMENPMGDNIAYGLGDNIAYGLAYELEDIVACGPGDITTYGPRYID